MAGVSSNTEPHVEKALAFPALHQFFCDFMLHACNFLMFDIPLKLAS